MTTNNKIYQLNQVKQLVVELKTSYVFVIDNYGFINLFYLDEWEKIKYRKYWNNAVVIFLYYRKGKCVMAYEKSNLKSNPYSRNSTAYINDGTNNYMVKRTKKRNSITFYYCFGQIKAETLTTLVNKI
jgi:hypothetical protein